jgi:hypothetical protein
MRTADAGRGGLLIVRAGSDTTHAGFILRT